MLPGAKGVTLMGLSRKEGTEQASLCPPDMTTQLTLWQGIFFPQGGRKWCLFPIPAGHHPCQAYGPSRPFPVASYLFPHHQTQATHGNGGQVLFHPDDLPGVVQMISRQMGHRSLVPNVSKQLVLGEELRPKKLTWVSLQPKPTA